jgi:hypothetical protein
MFLFDVHLQVYPIGPTEAQLKAETDIWDRTNNAEVSAFSCQLLVTVLAPILGRLVEFWMNTVTIKGQITSIPIPPITRYNRTSPVVANSANIAKSASLPSIDANTVTSNWQLQCRVKSTYFGIISAIPNICFCL